MTAPLINSSAAPRILLGIVAVALGLTTCVPGVLAQTPSVMVGGTTEDPNSVASTATELKAGEMTGSGSEALKGTYAQAWDIVENPTAPDEIIEDPYGPDEVEDPTEPDEIIEDPTAPEVILNESFAQPGSLFPNAMFPGTGYERFKKDLYERYSVKFSFSYQQLFQWASATLPNAKYDTALGGWAGFTGEWIPLDRGGDYEGKLVFQAGWRDSIGNNAVPAQFGAGQLGSAVSNYEFTSWGGTRIEDLYWEQRIAGNRFSFRVGNQTPQTVFNFSRFKNARVSYTASPFTFHDTIPYPTYGLGMSFRLRPLENSEFYVLGTLNDMNGEPAALGLDWSTFGLGQYFYGLEFGYFWRRNNREFDHLHLSLFYADKRSTRSPDILPNEPGGGFRVYGEKQFGRFVGLLGYTYNTAEGGGISATFTHQTITAGLAYLNPMNIRGEASLGLIFSDPIKNIFPGSGQRGQYTVDTYWRVQVTPYLTMTPAIWFIFDPSFNPTVNFQVVPQIKFQILF